MAKKLANLVGFNRALRVCPSEVKFMIDESWIFDDIKDIIVMLQIVSKMTKVEVLVQNRSAGLMAHHVSSLFD